MGFEHNRSAGELIVAFDGGAEQAAPRILSKESAAFALSLLTPGNGDTVRIPEDVATVKYAGDLLPEAVDAFVARWTGTKIQ